MEYLDIVDENGNPTGETVARSIAHTQGIRHRTAHVWIFRKRNDKLEVLLQKRSQEKDSYPGCYDISSAGHIPAGVDYIPSALRELQEELGISAQAEELIYCGQRRFSYENVFHGKPFVDNQVSNVYALWKDVEPKDLELQKSELESVEWIDFQECMEKVRTNAFPNCIRLDELEILDKKICE
ncbi:MAG: NUDIX domain-containing protein [Oscillospiraceae bacterium]|nr:NUDIX domain-containing protein [Oscillospiraceae bacterium]